MLALYTEDWYLLSKSHNVTLKLDPKEDRGLHLFKPCPHNPFAEKGGQAVHLNWNK